MKSNNLIPAFNVVSPRLVFYNAKAAKILSISALVKYFLSLV